MSNCGMISIVSSKQQHHTRLVENIAKYNFGLMPGQSHKVATQTLQHVQGTDIMLIKGTQIRGKTRGSMMIWVLTIL